MSLGIYYFYELCLTFSCLFISLNKIRPRLVKDKNNKNNKNNKLFMYSLSDKIRVVYECRTSTILYMYNVLSYNILMSELKNHQNS